MKRKNTISILILSIITTILTIVLFIYFIRVIKNKNEHISAVQTTLEEKEKAKANIIIFADKITEIKSFQDSIDNYFVDPNKIDTFVSYLEEIGPNNGSEVVVKSIEIPTKTKNLISIRLLINGNFQQVMETINLLENIPYQINITQIYLNKDIEQQTTTESVNPIINTPKIPTWQADIAFNILSL